MKLQTSGVLIIALAEAYVHKKEPVSVSMASQVKVVN